MKDQKNLRKDSQAQTMVEYLLLTMVVMFVVMLFALNPTSPFRETTNMILQDPIYMIHAASNQIRLN